MADDTAATTPLVKTENAVAITLSVTAGAKLPQVVAAALKIARHNTCDVLFTWERQQILLSASDTYQGAQRKIQQLVKPAGAKRK